MPEIIKIYKERLPALRFVGKCYTDNDRLNGSFGHKWGEWFQNGWFDTLEKLGELENVENGYIGFMRTHPGFEYWVGMFLPPGTKIPDGFGFIDIEESDVGVCWIKGKEDAGLYAMHEECVSQLKANGFGEFKTDINGGVIFFERYNCPRFTDKTEQGEVVLDYGVYLA